MGQFPVLASRSDNPAIYIVTSEFREPTQRLHRLVNGDSATLVLPVLSPTFPIVPKALPRARPALAARPGGGVAVGDGRTQYRIRVLDDVGTATTELRRDIHRVRKTRQEIEADRAIHERLHQNMASRVSRAALPSFTLEEHRWHFRAIQYDDQGRLWVQTLRGWPGATIFDLFSANGDYLGELRIARRLDAFALGSGLLAATTRDKDGVAFVAVWRVR
jgi:hypothetical protein